MSGQDVIRTVGSGFVSAFNSLSDLCYKGFDKLFNWIGSFFQGDGTRTDGAPKSQTSSSADQDNPTRSQTTASRIRSRGSVPFAANNDMNSGEVMPVRRISYASSMGGQQFASNVGPRFNEYSAGTRNGFSGRQMAFAHGGGCHFGGGRHRR
jgi:hypothetical protein